MGIFESGLLVAIEGIDGAGKSTLARGLAAALQEIGAAVVLTKEPTNGPHGRALRESAVSGRLTPEQELDLFVKDRRDHVDQLLKPALAAGQVVILDRYYFSNVAYQGAAGLNAAEILARNEAFAPRPDLLLVLDLDPATGLARIAARGDKANAFETEENLARCREIFRAATGGVRIDATQSAEAVLAEALQHIVAAATHTACQRHGFTPKAAESVRSLLGPALV